MPKVVFVNEHREVEVKAGRKISDIADELGIEVCREEFVGSRIGNYTCWVKGAPGAVSPPDWWEKLRGCKGWRRMANRTKVLGDIEVFTQQGVGSRIGQARPLSPAPRAMEDGSELFDHENNPAGTTWNPYGHPYAVGRGKESGREPPKYVPPVKKKRKKKAEPAPEPEEAKAEEAPADDAPAADADE